MDMKHKVLSGDECFELDGARVKTTVKDFWAWSMSRLIGDGPRGDLAEFIVNKALETDTTIPKRGWGECDIVYTHAGRPLRIEVKCSTLLQAWERESTPRPVFSIAKTLNCDIEETDSGYRYIGRDGSPPSRRSDVYVFCLFAEEDRSKANPLILDQWKSYVVQTKLIDDQLGDQRSISLRGLEKLGATPCGFHDIRPSVDKIAYTIQKKSLRM